MRAFLWILLLGSIGGGLLLWFSDPPEDGDAGLIGDRHGNANVPNRDGDSQLLRAAAQDVILIEHANVWPPDLMREGTAFMDPHALDQIEIVSPTGKEYSMTGAELLGVLEREFRGTPYQFRFKDEAARADFEKCVLEGPIPPHAPLRLLLDQAAFAGFAFVAYAGNIYVTPARPGELPGAGEVPPVPSEGVEPEPSRPR